MATEALLGIDIGTSSSKGVLVAPDGTLIARADRPHRTSTPRPGHVEHDAESVWWADFTAIVRELLDRADGVRVLAVGVSGIGPCLLPADAAGTPLRPAILYGVDTRATAEIAELTAEFGAERIVERGASRLTSQAVGPKLAWLRRHEPEVYASTGMLLMASSFLVHRLTGRYVLDHHSASQCDPLYDMRRGEWARDWADRVAPGLELPELAWSTEIAGTVTREAARLTGLPAGTPVATGTIDAWAEAASVGVRGPGDAMVMYGTTMFLVQVVDRLRPHAGLWGTKGAFDGTETLAAGMATSGAVTDWLRELVGGEFHDLVRAAEKVPAGSEGLLLLPYFAGERTPLFDPDARGVLAGLTTRHGSAEIYRAVLEGTAYGVRHNLEAMREAGGAPDRIVAVGGGAQGGLWPRIVSDVAGVVQEVPEQTIGAAFGDAFMAAKAIGLDADARAWNPAATTIRPDPERGAVYGEFYRHYRDLYAATRGITHFLAGRQHDAAEG
ncbi:xylulokinase [Spinactinospora alkalitolerans]|uniref:Xylulokinase n=1 Tax=Spinactinospora alkalitolerans TaxID=687207 RepID=A0A852U3S9_9ACTN|nr:FGGY-family carbohydrate kinase [Spinactinospora alkalitolerans]NYE50142.1 xylulokinase [Spinactinospora alkalitolerans]